ncbi:MAG TPA: hypothetical protein VFA68_18275 [Terriglobales bacterium]|nr:hypothetical protein [Terriglobales bacterium]
MMVHGHTRTVLLAVLVLLPTVVFAQYPGAGDSGQFVIISAQYGTEAHHVDVTGKLRELARQDRTVRMGNSTFGVDPDPGHLKTLRIYARGPRGEERMFEYRENSLVDGNQFRGWGTGQWGNERWSGRWEGNERGAHYEPQPEMTAAMEHLRQAEDNLQRAAHNKGGHRAKALELVQQALREVQAGIQFDDTH